MIKLNRHFFSVVDDLYRELDKYKSKEQVFNECVEDRLKTVLEVQGKYFDDELSRLELTLDWDLSDVKNIKNIANILNRLYKVIARDRISLIDSLISICEV